MKRMDRAKSKVSYYWLLQMGRDKGARLNKKCTCFRMTMLATTSVVCCATIGFFVATHLNVNSPFRVLY